MFFGLFGHFCNGYLTATGWQRVEKLKRAHISSKYAFFARRFTNPDLDAVYNRCLRPAVEATGYELRTVTQKAGLIDVIIENEIRRCPRTRLTADPKRLVKIRLQRCSYVF